MQYVPTYIVPAPWAPSYNSYSISANTYFRVTGQAYSPEMPWEGNTGRQYTVWSDENSAKAAVIREAMDLLIAQPGYPNVEYGYVIEQSPNGTYNIVGPYSVGSPNSTGDVPVPQNAVGYVHNHPPSANPHYEYPGTTVSHTQANKAPSAGWNGGSDWEQFDALMAIRGGAPLFIVIIGDDGVGRVYDQTSPRTPGYISPNQI